MLKIYAGADPGEEGGPGDLNTNKVFFSIGVAKLHHVSQYKKMNISINSLLLLRRYI